MGKREDDFKINVPDYYGTETSHETILWLQDLRFQVKGEGFSYVGRKRQAYVMQKTLVAALFRYARTWFEKLDQITRDNWEPLEAAFTKKYIDRKDDQPLDRRHVERRRPVIQHQQEDIVEHYDPNLFDEEMWEVLEEYQTPSPSPVPQQRARVVIPRNPVTPSRIRAQALPVPATANRVRHINATAAPQQTARNRRPGSRANVDLANDEQVPQLRRSPRILVRKRPTPEDNAHGAAARYQRRRYVSIDETRER